MASEATADQARYLFLTADLAGHAREERNELLRRMGVMGKGSVDAEVDRLMLEFCPDMLAPAQVNEWAAAQRVGQGAT